MDRYKCLDCNITFDNEAECFPIGTTGQCPECGTFCDGMSVVIKRKENVTIPTEEFESLVSKIETLINNPKNIAKFELGRISLDTLKGYNL